MAVTSKKGQEVLKGNSKLNTLPGFTEPKVPSANPYAQSTQNTHSTQGTQRKQKHPRINMAFYDDNLDYVREASYQSRMSVTEYVNKLIKEDRQRKALEPEVADGSVRPDGQFKGQLSIEDVE